MGVIIIDAALLFPLPVPPGVLLLLLPGVVLPSRGVAVLLLLLLGGLAILLPGKNSARWITPINLRSPVAGWYANTLTRTPRFTRGEGKSSGRVGQCPSGSDRLLLHNS